MEDPSKWVEKEDRWDTNEHYDQRKIRGFSDADWINFDTYIAWVIASAVEKMKSDGHTMFSFPDQPDSEWERLTHEEYDVMIKGFGQWAEGEESIIDLEMDEFRNIHAQRIRDLDNALDIFKKRFKSLWD